MIRDERTFVVTQALDRSSALNHACFEIAHMVREQRGESFEASQLLEISAELLQAEYYTSLNHLHQCLKALFEDPTLSRGLAYAELLSPLEYVKEQRISRLSGSSAATPNTTSSSSEPTETLSSSQPGTITPEAQPLSSSDYSTPAKVID